MLKQPEANGFNLFGNTSITDICSSLNAQSGIVGTKLTLSGERHDGQILSFPSKFGQRKLPKSFMELTHKADEFGEREALAQIQAC